MLEAVLERHLDAMRTATRDHDAGAYVQADRDFHLAIVAATGNEIITSLYRSLRERQLRMGTVNLLDGTGTHVDPARMASTLAEHERIRDALRAGRADAVVKAVGARLDHAESTLAADPDVPLPPASSCPRPVPVLGRFLSLRIPVPWPAIRPRTPRN